MYCMKMALHFLRKDQMTTENVLLHIRKSLYGGVMQVFIRRCK